MRNVRSIPFACITALVFSALVGTGCKEKKADAADAQNQQLQADNKGPRVVKFDPASLGRLGIKTEVASTEGVGRKLRVPGTLEYNLERYAEVGSLVEGRITSLTARAGDHVKKGQALATIAVPSIAKAQAEYVAAAASAQIAQDNATREVALLDKQLTTAREAEVAKGEMIRSGAERSAAAARLRVLGVGLPADGRAIQGAGSLTLSAPIDGIVVRRDAVMGRFMQPNETAFVVADPIELWATLEIYESDLPYFQINDEVEVTVDALPGFSTRGKVFLVEPQLGRETRVLRAKIAIRNDNGKLRPGLFVRASLMVHDEHPTDKTLFVPSGAVQPLGDGDVVFVELEPGKFEVRTVRVTRRTSQIAEVVEGLSDKERIVTEGAFLLRGEVTKQ